MDNIFVKTGDGYQGEIELPEWNAFFQETRKYKIGIGGEVEVDQVRKEHVDTYNFVRDNQKEILETLLQELLKKYPETRKSYLDDGESESLLPDIKEISEFREIIRLEEIHIMDVVKDGKCCVGFEFSCSWEMEHGLGFMTYDGKVSTIGHASDAVTNWVARDAIK